MPIASSQPTARRETLPGRIAVPSPRIALKLRALETAERHLIRSVTRIAVLLAADLTAFASLYLLATALRQWALLGEPVARTLTRILPPGYVGGWQLAAALFIGLLVTRNYGQGDRRRDPKRILAGTLMATALTLWQSVWLVGLPKSTLRLALTAGALWAALITARRGVDRLIRWYRNRTGLGERVLFVGDPKDPIAFKIQDCLAQDGMIPVGWVECTNGGGEPATRTVEENIWSELERLDADIVAIAGHLPEKLLRAVLEASAAAGCRTLFYPITDGTDELKPQISWHRGTPFVELGLPALDLPYLFLKRGTDLVGASLLLVLLAPLLALIAVLIKLDSKGPVFFVQERLGLGGRTFRLIKFRTMHHGAESQKEALAHLNRTGDPRLFKIPNDPRVTRLGAWLRRWSLDELPQLWNVLKGEMSLVGPRPFPASDSAGYQEHHFLRLAMRPGVTGLWQVAGRSDILDFEEVVRLDRQYVERWSFWLDFSILARTIPAVLRRKGAY